MTYVQVIISYLNFYFYFLTVNTVSLGGVPLCRVYNTVLYTQGEASLILKDNLRY